MSKNKNIFLIRFNKKIDLENMLRHGPWNFGRNMLVLACGSGEEQPSSLNMHFGV